MKTCLLKSERGSVIVETLASLFVVIAMASGGLIAAYTSFAYVWLERASYEAIVCLSTKASEKDCSTELQARAKLALPIGDVVDVRISRTRRDARVQLKFAYKDHQLFEHRDLRSLPLLPQGKT